MAEAMIDAMTLTVMSLPLIIWIFPTPSRGPLRNQVASLQVDILPHFRNGLGGCFPLESLLARPLICQITNVS